MKNNYLYIIVLWILITPIGLLAQSPNHNYIHTRTYTSEDKNNYLDQVQYFDGLGRPVQSVQRKITPSAKDLISLQEYDAFGREAKSWLPAAIDNNNGAYVDPTTLINASRATNTNNGISDQKPYSLPVYESSSLNRVLEQYAPGANWHKSYGSDSKALRTEYLTNNTGISTLNCIHYELGSQTIDTLVSIRRVRNYETGQLYVTRIEDEEGNTSFEFKNKLGQVVLTRQLENADIYDTYYIYDDFGNTSAVLPPLASEQMKTGTSWNNRDHALIRDYAYLYQYDARNRCIAKKLPGCDWIYYVYDKADRQIFTQDGEQRPKGEWTFTIPDVLGRIAVSGICKTANGNISIGRFNNNLIKAEFSTTGSYKGYNLKVDTENLTLGGSTVLSASYYDNYNFRGVAGIPSSAQTEYDAMNGYGTCYGDHRQENRYKSKGLLTGTVTAQFLPDGTVSDDYLYSVMYYDNKSRIIQTKSNNHLSGTEAEYIAYNFTGQPLRKKHIHTAILDNVLTTQEEVYTYQYDHAGRLYNVRHRLNNQPTVYLLQNRYDELGRLSKQGIGQVMPIPQSQPMMMAMSMGAAQEAEGAAEETGGDTSGEAEPVPEEPESPGWVKGIEHIGTLAVGGRLNHNTLLFADRGNTPDFEFILQESCWVTIEYPYSQVLGQTITTFFHYFNGVAHEMGFTEEAEIDMSTSGMMCIKYNLSAGTYLMNIYNPLVYDPNGTKRVNTTITLTAHRESGSGGSSGSGLNPNKEIAHAGTLSAGTSLAHEAYLTANEDSAPYMEFELTQNADVRLQFPKPSTLGQAAIKFYKMDDQGVYNHLQAVELKQDNSTTTGKDITVSLPKGWYVFCIYNPAITGMVDAQVGYVMINLSATGNGTPGENPDPNPDPDPYHPVDFTVTPAQVVEYDYNVRSWTTGIQNDLYSQQLQYGYSGNISRMDWQQQGQRNSYSFAYDELSRLTAAPIPEQDSMEQAIRTISTAICSRSPVAAKYRLLILMGK